MVIQRAEYVSLTAICMLVIVNGLIMMFASEITTSESGADYDSQVSQLMSLQH